jgi:hypothetical protein
MLSSVSTPPGAIEPLVPPAVSAVAAKLLRTWDRAPSNQEA